MIKIYNRKTNSYEEEKVAGEKYLSWCYDCLLYTSAIKVSIINGITPIVKKLDTI